MREIIILLLLMYPSAGLADISGKVTKVLDGDTIEIVTIKEKSFRIRIHGIDAPENSQPYGDKSTNNLKALCNGEIATVDIMDVDRFSRIVGVVYCAGKNAGLEQISAGYAWVYDKYAANDNCTAAIKFYYEAQEDSRAAKKGLWQDKNPVAPWDFRHKK